jgi:hypothetical protein
MEAAAEGERYHRIVRAMNLKDRHMNIAGGEICPELIPNEQPHGQPRKLGCGYVRDGAVPGIKNEGRYRNFGRQLHGNAGPERFADEHDPVLVDP